MPIRSENSEQDAGGGLSDAVGFWTVGALLTLFLAAAGVPSPLYGIYAARWHFSSLTLTIVFALYALALLVSLLVTGRLSDHVGRKPVIYGALALELLSMLAFIEAHSVDLLLAARVIAGLATGAAVGPLSASLTELSDERRAPLAPVVASLSSTVGLAIGAAGASVLVQYAPAPLRLVYWVVLGLLVASGILLLGMKETGSRRPGALASLKPIAEIPSAARSTFLRAVPALIGLWSLAGLYLSLGPGLILSFEHSSNLLWGGAAIFICWGCATLAGTVARTADAPTVSLLGCLSLLAGVTLTFIAVATSSGTLFLVSCAIAGTGIGPTWLGPFREITALAPPSMRSGTVASMYVVSYVAFSLPVIVAGVVSGHVAVRHVALGYCAAVAILEAIGAVSAIPAFRRSSASQFVPRNGEPALVETDLS